MKNRGSLLGLLFVVALITMGISKCNNESDRKEREDVERSQLQLVRNQPSPQFDWSLERHLLTELYKARNNAVATYSYVRNQFTGKVTSWCPSIGYPIPADTQLTNPLKPAYPNNSQSGIVEQNEPNGLYTSKNTRGTYVMCVNKEGKVVPRYHEADVEAYLVPMREEGGMLVEVEGSKPTFVIDPKRPVTHGK